MTLAAGNAIVSATRKTRAAAFPLSLALLSLLPIEAARAQTAAQTTSQLPATKVSAPDPEDIKRRAKELEDTREQQQKALKLQDQLKGEIASIGQDRTKLNQQLIDIASRVRGIESEITDTEGRLRPLDNRENQIRESLATRRNEIAEVLAALQRAGRRAPPALFVRPEDALQSLRTAMLLGAVVPDMRARATKLSSDLGELITLRKNISDERDRLASDRDKLNDDRTRLAALVKERQTKQSLAEKDMDAERQRASALSKQTESLQELIAKMEQDVKSAAKAAAAAELQGTPTTQDGKLNLGGLKDASRVSPAIAFASARGLLPMPVNGTKIRNFGAPDGNGAQEKGISVTTRAGAQVTTPCDGWVVYAGPFRSYGQLLILNAGGGYHVLIAGMERISVNIGQFVLTGEPVATMGSTSQVASILAAASSQPILYIEFRKDGTPIDPGPWWTATAGEKVRG